MTAQTCTKGEGATLYRIAICTLFNRTERVSAGSLGYNIEMAELNQFLNHHINGIFVLKIYFINPLHPNARCTSQLTFGKVLLKKKSCISIEFNMNFKVRACTLLESTEIQYF